MKRFSIFLSIVFNLSIIAEHGPLTTAFPISLYRFFSLKDTNWLLSQEMYLTGYKKFPKKDLPDSLKRIPHAHMASLISSYVAITQVHYKILTILTLRLDLPWYFAEGVEEAFYDSGGNFREIYLGRISGFSDPGINSKLSLWQNDEVELALLNSLKFPLGKTSYRNEAKPLGTYLPEPRILGQISPHITQSSPNANPLNDVYQVDPSLMPGSGAFAFSLGYLLRYEDSQNQVSLVFDFFRFSEFQQYRLGDLFLASLSYERLLVQAAPFFYLHFGLSFFQHSPNQYKGENFPNSGNQIWFSLWGSRIKINSIQIWFTLALPIWQFEREPQQQVDKKANLGISISF